MAQTGTRVSFAELDRAVSRLPRCRIGLYPTPFHKLENLSSRYGVSIFLKREDLAGPGLSSGSKTRLAEFILGRALQEGVTHVITKGAYLTNSGVQFAAASIAAGITPILYLQDESNRGPAPDYRANLFLGNLMGVEINLIPTPEGENWLSPGPLAQVEAAMEGRRAALESEGRKALVVPGGGAHPDGFVAHALTFKEIVEQAAAAETSVDFIYHTAGTGTALPGLLAGKLASGSSTEIRSIAINPYRPDYWISTDVIVDRVKHVGRVLGLALPPAEDLRDLIDLDQRFIGPDYAVPTPEATAALHELARTEGVIVGPVYTAKGMAGMLEHIRTGKVPQGSNVVFLHTGDAVNVFEIEQVAGPLLDPNE